jgi:hypothetical protein
MLISHFDCHKLLVKHQQASVHKQQIQELDQAHLVK